MKKGKKKLYFSSYKEKWELLPKKSEKKKINNWWNIFFISNKMRKNRVNIILNKNR